MGDSSNGSLMVRVPSRIDLAGGWSDVHYFSAREGGAVVNAAIGPYVEGRASWQGNELRLEYTLSLPPGSHLGTSSSIDVAWLRLTNGLMGQDLAPAQLAEQAYHLEKLLGVEGGKQDQYAAALGPGFHLLRFGTEDKPAEVERLDVAVETTRALQERLVICFSGAGTASSVHVQVWERYRAGDAGITDALRRIRDSAFIARDALLGGDLATLADTLTTNREQTRRLHPDAITARMDELFAAGEAAGAIGSKPCGAGGGGSLLFLCAEDAREQVEDALRARNGEIVAFQFA